MLSKTKMSFPFEVMNNLRNGQNMKLLFLEGLLVNKLKWGLRERTSIN